MELKLTDAMEIKVRVCCLVILAGGSLNSSFGFFFFFQRKYEKFMSCLFGLQDYFMTITGQEKKSYSRISNLPKLINSGN